MKNIKKLLSIVMVLTLVLALGAQAFADGAEAPATSTVTIAEELAGHSFTAYQIFTGTQNAESGNKLASVAWGSGINAAGFVAALNALGAPFGSLDAADAAAVAEAISKADAEMAKKVAEAAADNLTSVGTAVVAPSTELPNGYYLIKDTTPADDLNGNAAYNDVVLQVTETVAIQYKTDVPEVEKKVQDNDSTAWQDSADWDIDDPVPFQITGTLPTNYGDYDSYAITFHDDQSDGLTLNESSIVVTAGAKTLAKGTDYTVVTSGLTDGCAFEIVINNLKAAAPDAAAGGTVVVTYTSTLNDDAVVGVEGNPNTVTMDFSNNAHGEGTGTTPKDTVIVFTYEFEADKVHPVTGEDGGETMEPLEGAGFTLYKQDASGAVTLEGHDGKYTAVGEEMKGVTEFEFKGLDDGTYVLVETTVPAGFNKAADIEFTITAEHDVLSDDPALTKFTARGAEGSNIDVNEDAESGTATGKITTQVVNREGLELPETGGIGTTIFYVVGGILVAAAVILLVTKRRVSGAEK